MICINSNCVNICIKTMYSTNKKGGNLQYCTVNERNEIKLTHTTHTKIRKHSDPPSVGPILTLNKACAASLSHELPAYPRLFLEFSHANFRLLRLSSTMRMASSKEALKLRSGRLGGPAMGGGGESLGRSWLAGRAESSPWRAESSPWREESSPWREESSPRLRPRSC